MDTNYSLTGMSTNPNNGPALSESERRWLRAAEALAPEQSLARAASNGRFVVTLVVVISSLLSGFGAVTLSAVSLDPFAKRIISLVIVLVTASLALALSCLVLRTRSVAIGDLRDVERWYLKELTRMRRIALAGWLLVAALVISGSLGAYLVWTMPDAPAEPPATTDRRQR